MKIGKCIYYRSPIHFCTCEKNVNYRDLAGGNREGYLTRLPCVTTKISKNQSVCTMYTNPTLEQIENWKNEIDKKIKEILINKTIKDLENEKQ